MSEAKQEKSLTAEQQQAILKAINASEGEDDRAPEEVILDRYHGDRIAYLRDMGIVHGIIMPGVCSSRA